MMHRIGVVALSGVALAALATGASAQGGTGAGSGPSLGSTPSAQANSTVQTPPAEQAPLAKGRSPQSPDAAPSGRVEEVVVTAQRRSENVQTTPIAITALSANALSKLGVDAVRGVTLTTPTLTSEIYPSSSTTLGLFMRGLGVGDPLQITKDGSIGIYVDGIYAARPQAATLDLADVDRIEVLRGPQGTLYGRNTTGGAINIISKAPTGQFGLDETGSYGNYDEWRTLTNLNLPDFHGLDTKLTFLASNRGGYVDNSGGNNFDSDNQVSGRFSAHYQPVRPVTIDYAFDLGRDNSTPPYYTNPSLTGATLTPGYTYAFSPYSAYRPVDLPTSPAYFFDHTLIASWRVTPNLELKSLSGYRHFDTNIFQDYAESFGYGYQSQDYLHADDVSEEIQANGSLLNGVVKFNSGLYYFDSHARHQENQIIYGGYYILGRFVSAVSLSKAAYAQATITPPILDNRLSLTVGLRYTDDERSAFRTETANGYVTEAPTQNHQHFDKTNPAVTLDYRITPDINTYFRYATGYRAGGSSESSADFTQTFGPESVTSYEVGLKSDLLDHRIRANLAVFDADYSQIQIDFQADPTNAGIVDTINAGSATIDGVEIDTTFVPTPDLTLNASYAYLNTSLSNVVIDGQDLTHNFVLPFAPHNNTTLSGDYVFLRMDERRFTFHADTEWRGAAYSTSGDGPAVVGRQFFKDPHFDLLNLKLTMDQDWAGHPPIRISLYGRNVTNLRYVNSAIGNGSVFTGYGSSAEAFGEPATYGFEVSVRY